MPASHFLSLVSLACVASFAFAAVPPLTSLNFTYPNLPYKVDPDTTGRGPQSGYAICNSTTEGPTSLCQVAFIDALDDFCVWAPATPNSTIADTEAATVAWCTKPGHGTRLIPAGALQGVQFMRTSAYVQVTGVIEQSFIDIVTGDTGGEMDPHGDDERGNPLGGLVFSNAFPSNGGNNNSYQQVIQWHNFMGSNIFCFKACDNSVPNSAQYCLNIYDTAGCGYNAPAAYAPDVFESCQGDLQTPPGTIPVGQPVPVPASSNCVTFQSAALYTALPSASTTSSAASSTSAAVSRTSSTTTATAKSSGGVDVGARNNHVGLVSFIAGGIVLGVLALFS